MSTVLKSVLAMAMAGLLFTGCSDDDIKDFGTSGNDGGNSSSDVISISKTGKDFRVLWIKNNSEYGEVISEGQTKDTYPRTMLTDNGAGTVTLTCEFSSYFNSNAEAKYTCKASNLSGDLATKTVRMKEGVQYQWYPTYGFDHEEGEVDATTEYTNGMLIVE